MTHTETREIDLAASREDELERLMVAAAQKAFHDFCGDRLTDGAARAILSAVVRCMSDYSKKTGRSYVP